MKIGKYRFGFEKKDSLRIGFFKYPLYYVKWGFQIGPLFVEKWNFK